MTAAATSGSCSVTATQAGNATYNTAISAAFVIIIEGGPPPAITLFCPAAIPVSGTGTCLATSSTGLTTFTYAAFGDCTVNSTTGVVTAATAVTTGSCSVTASQAGNATYPPATSAPSSIAITKLNQTVNLFCPSTLAVSGTGICSATTTSGLTTFTFSATGACTIHSAIGVVTAAVTTGICSVTATQAGNGTYNPATSAPSSIMIAFVDPFYIVTATAGPGGSITPASQVVFSGSTATFTVTPDVGYTASVTDTCGSGGSLSGMTYTTGAVSMDCAATASFVDTTPPVITPNPLGRSTLPFIGPLTVTLSSNEPNTTVFYTMNGGTPTTSSPSCAAPCTLTITKSTLLQYRGRDAAGNLSAPAYQVYKIAAVDLVMTHVSKTATTVKRGASFAITNAARNIGTLRSLPFKISFYLSTDRIITPADMKLSGYRTIPFGLAGQTSTLIAATTVTVPIATPSGIYYVAACIDSDKLVSESEVSPQSCSAG